jgi:hypothetical protein
VPLQKDLKEFLQLLLSKKVEFVVVGAHAVAFHGHPRLTGDIDFLVRVNPENAARLETVFREFGFQGPPFVASEFEKAGQVFQVGRPPNRIDVITAISGVSTEDVWRDRVPGKLSELDVSFISRAQLLLNKSSTGRAKDLADVETLNKR